MMIIQPVETSRIRAKEEERREREFNIAQRVKPVVQRSRGHAPVTDIRLGHHTLFFMDNQLTLPSTSHTLNYYALILQTICLGFLLKMRDHSYIFITHYYSLQYR